MKISKINNVEVLALRIVCASNSEPIPATSKQIRLESERFHIVPGDQVGMLTFSAPG